MSLAESPIMRTPRPDWLEKIAIYSVEDARKLEKAIELLQRNPDVLGLVIKVFSSDFDPANPSLKIAYFVANYVEFVDGKPRLKYKELKKDYMKYKGSSTPRTIAGIVDRLVTQYIKEYYARGLYIAGVYSKPSEAKRAIRRLIDIDINDLQPPDKLRAEIIDSIAKKLLLEFNVHGASIDINSGEITVSLPWGDEITVKTGNTPPDEIPDLVAREIYRKGYRRYKNKAMRITKDNRRILYPDMTVIQPEYRPLLEMTIGDTRYRIDWIPYRACRLVGEGIEYTEHEVHGKAYVTDSSVEYMFERTIKVGTVIERKITYRSHGKFPLTPDRRTGLWIAVAQALAKARVTRKHIYSIIDALVKHNVLAFEEAEIVKTSLDMYYRSGFMVTPVSAEDLTSGNTQWIDPTIRGIVVPVTKALEHYISLKYPEKYSIGYLEKGRVAVLGVDVLNDPVILRHSDIMLIVGVEPRILLPKKFYKVIKNISPEKIAVRVERYIGSGFYEGVVEGFEKDGRVFQIVYP